MKERELAEALGGIHAPEGLRQRIMELGEQPRRKAPALKYAVPAALAVVLILGAALWPRPVSELVKAPQEAPRTAAPMQPAAPESQGQAPAVHPTPARPPVPGKKTIFLAVAAAGYGGVGETVNLAQNQTVTIQTEGDQNGASAYATSGETGKYDHYIFYEFPFRVVGDGIVKVTYEINKGFMAPYGTAQDSDSEESKSYDGRSYMVDEKTDTGEMIIGYTAESDSSPDSYDSLPLSEYWKQYIKEVQGTQLKVTATFADGATCEKNVALSTDDGAHIKATLLD